MTQSKTRKLDFRRARTRTLIQLGGLVEKAGLTDLFNLELGQDLQTEDENFDDVAALLGAFIDMKNSCDINNFSQQKLLWADAGKSCMAQN